MIALPTIATAAKTSENHNQTDHNPSKHIYIYYKNKPPIQLLNVHPFQPNNMQDLAPVLTQHLRVHKCNFDKRWCSVARTETRGMHGYTTASAGDDIPASYTSCVWQDIGLSGLSENWGVQQFHGLSMLIIMSYHTQFSDTDVDRGTTVRPKSSSICSIYGLNSSIKLYTSISCFAWLNWHSWLRQFKLNVNLHQKSFKLNDQF